MNDEVMVPVPERMPVLLNEPPVMRAPVRSWTRPAFETLLVIRRRPASFVKVPADETTMLFKGSEIDGPMHTAPPLMLIDPEEPCAN